MPSRVGWFRLRAGTMNRPSSPRSSRPFTRHLGSAAVGCQMPDDTQTSPDDAPLPPVSIGPDGPPAVTSTRTSTVMETRTTASATEPVDDVVTTRHTIAVGGKSLSHKATAGRVVLREEKYEDGVSRSSARCRGLPDVLCRRRRRGHRSVDAPGGLRLQMAAPGARAYGCTSASSAAPSVAGMSTRGGAATGLSTMPRPCWRTAIWCSSTRCRRAIRAGIRWQAQTLPRLYRRHRVDRRGHSPWTSREKRWLAPKFAHRRVLWHASWHRARRAPAEHVRDVSQRAGADL